jgi:hypothetical protein
VADAWRFNDAMIVDVLFSLLEGGAAEGFLEGDGLPGVQSQ